MKRTAKYYKTHPKARAKKAITDKKINARPEQKAKRRELGRANYAHDKAYGSSSRAGKDLAHTKSGLKYKKSSVNRGSKRDMSGDRRARG